MRLPPLTAETAPGYLRERGILRGASDSPVRTTDLTRRNHNLAVEVEGAGAWFIKQIQFHTPEVVASLEREAACYRAAQKDPVLAPLSALMARLVDFDEANSILILEFLRGLNAVECHMRVGPFDARIAEILGRLLGTLHRVAPAALQSRAPEIVANALPWVLKPVGAHDHAGSRTAFLSQVLSDASLAKALETAREDWQAGALIHGDSRLDNFLLCRPAHDGAPLDARLIDWELAGIGDPVWDCASVMQHYWSHWMSAGSPSPERWDELAAALAAFWEAYTSSRGITGSASRQSFRRATIFTGIRLVQKAYEQFAAQGSMQDVSRSLHLARMLLTETGEALKGFTVYTDGA